MLIIVSECLLFYYQIIMTSEKLIKFVENELTIMEIEELEQELLKNPQLLEILGGLNRIKKELPSNENLHDHLREKKEEIREKIWNKEQLRETVPTDDNYEDKSEYIIRLMTLARKKLEPEKYSLKPIQEEEITDLLAILAN